MPLVLLVLAAFVTPAAGSQVIDRMVAVVDGEVVTRSDVEDYRVLARGFRESVSEDDAVILSQIIEDMLIARQIAQFQGNVIREADLEAYLGEFVDSGELSGERLLTLARRRLELEGYFASLRRSLRATDAEMLELYETELVPALRDQGGEIPPFAQVRDELEDIVLADKLVQEIAARVELLYRRYQVEVVE